MGIIRPATPGFLATLIATGCLAAVSFCVPWIQSVFFLKASFSSNGQSGSITFGTLGYCLQLPDGTTCSKPAIGYELGDPYPIYTDSTALNARYTEKTLPTDINSLVGNRLPIRIPQVVVKWITYCLFLHVVALVLAAGSAVFGLLAHIREMSMTCFSTCISGFAAVVALLAFIFDIAFFFLARARINAVRGGSATIGSAIWLTLLAWILLFCSGCFYTLGRCCISDRGPRRSRWGGKDDQFNSGIGPSTGYADQMRLDAVKAEADRKARQEVGLPAFSESQPLKARIEGDEVFLDDDTSLGSYDQQNVGPAAPAAYARRLSQNQGYGDGQPAGYVQGPAGGRAVDEYYTPSGQPPSTYPPRQPSMTSSVSNYSTPSYAPSNNPYNPNVTTATNNQYLSPYQQYNQPRYADTAPQPSQYRQYYGSQSASPPPQSYGHTANGTSYHSAVTHQQYPSNYTQHDAYDASFHARAPSVFNADTYNNTGLLAPSLYATPQQQPDRNYTLGGDGYGANVVPAHHPESESNQSSFFLYQGDSHAMTASPAPINTDVPAHQPSNTSPVKGPRSPRSPTYDDNPPGYEAGLSQPPGAWGAKR